MGEAAQAQDRASASGSPARPAPGAAGAIELDPVDVQGSGAGGAKGAEGYVAIDSSVATKTDTPLIEVPQSVSVITQQQLQDRNVQTLIDAVNYTAGVETGTSGYDPRFDSFYIRGFDVTYTGIYRDQLFQPASGFAIYKTEPYGLQGITVLRGPAAALYGPSNVGGIIDLTSKRPTLTPLHEVEFDLGTFQRYQGSFDLGGPIDPAGAFSYRLTGLFRDADTQFPGGKDNRNFVAPALTYRPDAATSFTILTEYMNSRTTANPQYYQTPEGVLTNLYSGDPTFGNFDQTQFRIGYIFEHKINEVFTFRQDARYAYVFADAKYVDIASIDPLTQVASRVNGRIIDHLGGLSVNTEMQARFLTGPVSHQALMGLGYTYSTVRENYGDGVAPDLYVGAIPPAYGGQFIPSPAYTSVTRQEQQDLGVYLQDQARFGPFILTLSGRNDWSTTRTDDLLALSSADQGDQAATGRAGLTYLSPFGLAPYVSYATSFVPVIGVDAAGAAFKPITGDQKEIGVKYQPPGINGLITAALFDIHQFNTLSTDPSNLAFQIQTGEIRSRGFELEGVINPLPSLNVTLAYTLLDLTILNGDLDTIGKTPSGIPTQSFSVWGDYTLQPDTFAPGLGAGFGMRFIGQSYGNDQNTFVNQQVTLFDAALHYDFEKLDRSLAGLRLQVNATNLFNTKYQISQAGFGYWGQDRTVIAALRYRW